MEGMINLGKMNKDRYTLFVSSQLQLYIDKVVQIKAVKLELIPRDMD